MWAEVGVLEHSSNAATSTTRYQRGAEERATRGRSSEKALLSPGLIHVSTKRRKSGKSEEQKSFRMKVLFVSDPVLIGAMRIEHRGDSLVRSPAADPHQPRQGSGYLASRTAAHSHR